MATRGTLTVFEEFARDIGTLIHNLDTGSLRLGLVDETTPVPVASQAAPAWGIYSGNQVATTGNYVNGGFTLPSPAYSEAGGVGTLDDPGADLSLAQDAINGFDNAYYAILYNDTAASDQAIAFIDLDGPLSEQDGPITIAWHSSGILTVTVT